MNIFSNGINFRLFLTKRTAEIISIDSTYANNSTNIIIPEKVSYLLFDFKVTSIGANAFANCKSLTSINIPSSVKNIADHAFLNCSSLVSVVIPDSVTNIGFSAFCDCTSLTSINIPDSVEEIGNYAFSRCYSLTSITIPSSVQYIGDHVFEYCTFLKENFINNSWETGSLGAQIAERMQDGLFLNGSTIIDCQKNVVSVEIPDNVTIIAKRAFQNCYSLNTITIPDSVTSIGESAFSDCSSLKTITIPDSVTSIGEWAFSDCSSLESTTLPNTITKIESHTFAGCSSLTSVAIPINVISIGLGAFANCSSLTSIDIPNNVKEIDGCVFSNCLALAKITIPESVTHIRGSAFSNCSSLTEITIPESVIFVGENVFKGCISLPVVDNIRYADTYLVEAVDKSCSTYSILQGTKWIGDRAFNKCSSLVSINIPDSIISIEEWAFANCKSLQSIVIPTNLNSIKYGVFYGCLNLTNIIWNAKKCTDLHLIFCDIQSQITSFTFGDNVEHIPTGLCSMLNKLQSINISKNVKTIGDKAFMGCELLTSIIIPDSVTKIGKDAFHYTGLYKNSSNWENNMLYINNCLVAVEKYYDGELLIRENTRLIADKVFNDCYFTSLKFPNSLTTIEDSICANCNTLISVTLGNCVNNIGNYAFYNCESLRSIVIPKSITHIGNYAFKYCSSLNTIYIPNNVTSIGEYAFSGCYSLKTITIPDSVANIGKGTFSDCSNITTIVWNAKQCEDFSYETSCFSEIASQIRRFTFGNNVIHIPAYLCQGMNILTEINIPISVISIGKKAFAYCTAINSIIIPKSIIKIGHNALSGCEGLTSIIWNPISITGFFNEEYVYPIFIGCKNVSSIIFGNEVKEIPKYLCLDMSKLTSIILPNSVTNIEYRAFKGCESLKLITIGDGVKYFASEILKGCKGLEKIYLPKEKKEEYCRIGLEEYRDFIQYSQEDEDSVKFYNMARAYELGIDVKMNFVQAVIYYIKSAEKGNADAAFHLGELYENGNKLPKDYQQAISFYNKAFELSHTKALARIQQCQQLMSQQKRSLSHQQSIQRNTTKYLFFDTETNGLPNNYNIGITATDNWPRMIQLAWIVTDEYGNMLKRQSHLIYPQDFTIDGEVEKLTGISTLRAQQEGVELKEVLSEFMNDLANADEIIGHNIDFDRHIVGCELYRTGGAYDELMNRQHICTMQSSTDFCAIPSNSPYGGYKWPKLEELYRKLFGRMFDNAHDALADVVATKECFFALKQRGIVK